MHSLKPISALARLCALLALPLLVIGITGCAANFGATTASPVAAVQGAALHGVLMGGEQPIKNAQIYLYSAGNIADGIGGYTPGYGSASHSLVSDGNGHNYVLTSATGAFSITGDYTCPQQNSQVYLLSIGGDPGIGGNTNNSAIVLMAALGTCGNLSSSTFITINELTTVAAITALQQFIVDPTHIGTSSSNVQGLKNAFQDAALLVDVGNGIPRTDTSLVKFPSAKILTLGNAMVGCVNAATPSGGTCPSYFAAAVDESNPTTTPTTVFQAQFNISRYPSANPGGVISSTPNITAFGPSLTSVNDFSLAVSYAGGGIAAATGIAIDQSGNAFVSSCGHGCDSNNPYNDAVIEIQPNGATGNLNNGYIASGSGYGVGSINVPQAIAINQSSYLAATNGNSTLSALQPDGTNVAGTPLSSPSLVIPEGIGFDVNSTAWIANAGNQTVVPFDLANGPGTALTNTSLQVPTGVALAFNQPYNNVIVTDNGGSSAGGVVIFKSTNGTYDGGSYTHNGALHPGAVALDASQNIWEVDSTVSAAATAKVFKLSSTGTAPYTASSGVAIPSSGTIEGLAIDGLGNVILPSCTTAACHGNATDNLFFLDNTGTPITGRNGLQDAHLNNPVAAAIDPSGNIWVASAGFTANGAVTKFIGLAAPVQTPIANAVASQTTGTRP